MYGRGASPLRHLCASRRLRSSQSILALLHWLLLLTRVSASPGPPPHTRSRGAGGGGGEVQAGLSHRPARPLSPSLTARLIKNHINPKTAHVVLNQFEVSVRIK